MSRSNFVENASAITKAFKADTPRFGWQSFQNVVFDSCARMPNHRLITEAVDGQTAEGEEHIPPTEPERPTLPEGPTSLQTNANFQIQLTMYEKDLKIFEDYHSALFAILQAIHDALPSAVQPLIKINNNLRDQTPFGAMQILEQLYGRLLNSELQSLTHELADALPMNTSVENHIARHREIHRILHEHDQGVTETMQVNMLIGTLPAAYNSFLERYHDTHHGIHRDYHEFATLLLLNTNNKIVYGGPPMAHTATAAAVTSTPTLDSVVAELAALRLLISKDKNVAPTKKYCWTHGNNTSHNSGECRFPAEGHKTTATSKDKQGGREKPFQKYGKR